MDAWRIRLELEGPLGTGLVSGTIFGHLCWAMVERERGATGLERLLARLAQEPFLLSDALPADLLPRPLVPPPALPPDRAAAERHKADKRLGWLRREHFLAVRGKLDAATLGPGLVAGPDQAPVRTAHNRIDRRTGTTPEEGGLFFTDEWWPSADDRFCDLYVQTAMPVETLLDLVAWIGRQGFGRDATYGRGRFRVDGHEPERVLLAGSGNRLMSLAHGSLTGNMQDARWKLWTHFGKVGAHVTARGGRPWKRPLLLLRPGCTWRATETGPFGAWLDKIYQDEQIAGHAVGHHAFHLPVPFTEPRAAGEAA